MDSRVYLPSIIGRGYKNFWNYKGRYLVCKGSRASKKSTTTSLKIIYYMMKYAQANTLVVRRYFNTLRDSCYSQLKWAIHQLGVESLWKCTTSPLEMTYLKTGQKILFRGMDDPLKLTSVTVDKGVLCWVWFEEAYQMESEKDFDLVDGSIRGVLPPGYFNQLILTLNPWSERHWIKGRFFDNSDDNRILSMTTNYLCNEFLSEDDQEFFNQMRINNPKYYSVAGLGNWGISEGLIYDCWKQEKFNIDSIRAEYLANGQTLKHIVGIDFGYTNDPTAIIEMWVDTKMKHCWITSETYQNKLLNSDIGVIICSKNFNIPQVKIVCDSAEPKSIADLKLNSKIYNVMPCTKGSDSIRNGIQKVQAYCFHVDPSCTNVIDEFSNYQWKKDKEENVLNEPIDKFNHAMDAIRYGITEAETNRTITLIK